MTRAALIAKLTTKTMNGEIETPGSDATCNECKTMSRRQFVQAGATVAMAAATSGVAAADGHEDDNEEIMIDYGADLTHDPWVEGSITVDAVSTALGDLGYITDTGEESSLKDLGYVLARDPEDEDTVNNPVTFAAASLYEVDEDDNRQNHEEFGAFPRGGSYDHDSDSATDEEPVSVLDSTHWTTTDASTGTISTADVDNGAIQISTSSMAGGDTAKATFDLSSVASSDETITSGMSRKVLQLVMDVDTVPTGGEIQIALIDSSSTEVSVAIDPDGDSSTVSVLGTSTGDSQVYQVRVGDLETDQSVDLTDIQKVQVRVTEADADVTFHGINAERESLWTFGTQEYQTTNNDGETVVETQDVEEPTGDFSVSSLKTLDGTPFQGAHVEEVTYDCEQVARNLPADDDDKDEHDDEIVMTRVKETPDTFDRPHELEVVRVFEGPSAYGVGATFDTFNDTVQLPSGRYQGVEVATGISAIEDWEDVEDSITWTSKSDLYSSVEEDVELLSSLSSSDRTAVRHRVILSDAELDSVTKDSEAAAAVAASGGSGGGGGFNYLLTLSGAAIAGLVAFFRKDVAALWK